MAKISVIIPVYRVEGQIAECIRSICRQSLPPYEIILVDDATDDGSMAVAGKVLAEFPSQRALLLHHDRNRGISAARNTGLDAATGDYVLFADSDDELMPDALERLSAPLSQKDWDVVVGNYIVRGTDRKFPLLLGEEGPIEGNSAVRKAYWRRLWYAMAWNKLFRMDYIRSSGLRFEEGVVHEDELWSVATAFTASSLYIVRADTYVYKIRPGSFVTSEHYEERLQGWEKILQCCRQYVRDLHQETERISNRLLQRLFLLAVEVALPYGEEAFRQNYFRMRAALPDGRWKFLLASRGHWSDIRRDLHWVLPEEAAARRFIRRYNRRYRKPKR